MIASHHEPTALSPPGAVKWGAKRAVLLLTAMFACAGCTMTAKEEPFVDIPIDYRQRHPIAVREGDRTMEVFVGARRGALTPTQRTEVMAYADIWRREATGGIIIEIPAGTANAHAAAATAGEIRAVLAGAGVPPRAIVVRRYRPGDPAQLATVKLNYPKMVAQAGPCGLWPQDLALTHDSQPTKNRPYWNLGCSTQRNLASMVDNPADLVQPRIESPIYSARRSTALDKYRRGESSAIVYPDAGKGAISDVGK